VRPGMKRRSAPTRIALAVAFALCNLALSYLPPDAMQGRNASFYGRLEALYGSWFHPHNNGPSTPGFDSRRRAGPGRLGSRLWDQFPTLRWCGLHIRDRRDLLREQVLGLGTDAGPLFQRRQLGIGASITPAGDGRVTRKSSHWRDWNQGFRSTSPPIVHPANDCPVVSRAH